MPSSAVPGDGAVNRDVNGVRHGIIAALMAVREPNAELKSVRGNLTHGSEQGLSTKVGTPIRYQMRLNAAGWASRSPAP